MLPSPDKADSTAPSNLHRLLHLGFSQDKGPESGCLYAGTPLRTVCLHVWQSHLPTLKLTLCLAIQILSGFAYADSASPSHQPTSSALPFCPTPLLSW